MKGKTAIIGDGESILVFKAVGIEPFSVTTSEQAEKTLNRIAKTHQIIFITDDYAKEIDGCIKKYASESYPIIVSIPSKAGSNGYGLKTIKDATEKALGIDLFPENVK